MDTIILNSSVLPDDAYGHDVVHFNYFILLDFFPSPWNPAVNADSSFAPDRWWWRMLVSKLLKLKGLFSLTWCFLPSLCLRYDYVEVIDGENENGRLWGKFCGKIAPSPVVSSGPFLFIKFVSDYETHGAGFSIRYEIFKRGE